MRRVGILDADLIDGGTRFPNLCSMKISAHCKQKGDDVRLIEHFGEIPSFDFVYVSKVFEKTKIAIPPLFLAEMHGRIKFGGTGFFFDKAEPLAPEIEHIKPDYSLYDGFVKKQIEQGKKAGNYKFYREYSIGFTTRGCFRKCPFCVNQRYNQVERNSPVQEFLDDRRKKICLLDDNVLGYKKWQEVFEELNETGKKFQFRQGVDMRIMTAEKAIAFNSSKYDGPIFFAFDNYEDKEEIIKRLKIFRNHCEKPAMAYVLCGFDSVGLEDIKTVFERIKILNQFGVNPYLMRFKSVYDSPYRVLYSYLAAWCNQLKLFKTKTFREYCEIANERTKKPETLYRTIPDEMLDIAF